jgi:phosphoserine aminotransferase
MARKKIYNFSSTQTALPEEISELASIGMWNYKNKGISVYEMGVNSQEYNEIKEKAESSLRKVLNIPQNYKVLFVQGDSVSQFAAIPLKLLSGHKCADYVLSGQFSKLAISEAKKYADIAEAASSAGASPAYSTIPELSTASFRPDADYVHICFSDTIHGTKFHYIPDTGNIPLVAEMSGFLLSEPIELSHFSLIYAELKKNVAPTSLTVLIMRDDIVGNAVPETPSIINYKLMISNSKLCNTPSAHELYLASLVFDWILENGGLEEMKRRNERKASLLYDYIDSQSYYTNPVDKKCRSLTNIIFVTGDANLDKKFIKEARREGLINLESHSSLGGMNASNYNSMTYEGIEKLIDFMKAFAAANPKLFNI